MRSLSIDRQYLSVLAIALGYWFVPCVTRADDWPQWLGPNREGVWREAGLQKTFPRGGPKIVWRTAIGSGFSGPAVAGGRVLVMDRIRAKDADGKPTRPTKAGVPG